MTKFLAVLLLLIAGRAGAAQTLLVLGDSLSAGFGIAVEQSWPALLQTRLQQEKLPYKVVNASISGETTAGGRSRLPTLLKQHRPALLILALGANDGLRGLPLDPLRENLAEMAASAQAAGARVLIAGMELPPNYGVAYTRQFAGTFTAVAKQQKAALLPFLLEPIARDESAFQADRLHPTAAAQPKILDHVWRQLKPLLK
jgi:acyl-CoA thioesterase-1